MRLTKHAKPSILDKIAQLKAMFIEKGRKPIILLVNEEANRELAQTVASVLGRNNTKSLKEIFDLDVLVSPRVADFFIVDDRHWYEQFGGTI